MIIELFSEYLNSRRITRLRALEVNVENPNCEGCYLTIAGEKHAIVFWNNTCKEVADEINKQIKVAKNLRHNWDDVVSDMATKGQSMYYTPYPKDIPIETDNI